MLTADVPARRRSAIRHDTIAYACSSLVLGVVWYCAIFHVAGGDFTAKRSSGEIEYEAMLCASAVISTSIVAFLARRSIRSAGLGKILWLGCTLPIAGGAVGGFLAAFGAGTVDLARGHVSALGLPLEYAAVMSAVFAIRFCYVTFPLGIASVFVLRVVDRLLCPAKRADSSLQVVDHVDA